MTTEWLADDAHKAFRAFLTTIKPDEDINEAATRLRFIDDILIKVLQWDKNHVWPESHVKNVGYIDYEFNKPRPSLILEAKSVDKTFILPGYEYPAEPVPFSLIASECKEAAAALTQCQNYANKRGARYSAISNGHQWLLSMTFVQNEPVEDRLVYVFESLDAINKKFRAFFECFGPMAIRSNQPSMKLLDARRAPAPAKFSTTIPGYPVAADRNSLAPSVGGLLQLIWEAIDGDQDNELFLRSCYIPSAPSSDMLKKAHTLLSQRATTDEQLAAADVKPATRRSVLEHQDRSDREQPVVILGRIGHGKSTFLKYLRHIEAKDILSSKYLQIDLNFLRTPATAAEVPNFVMRRVQEQLKGYGIEYADDPFVRRVLKRELNDFRKSPRGVLLKEKPDELREAEVDFLETFTNDAERYMALVMKFIRRSHHKSVAIFFDNLDRRGDDLQEAAFLRAAAMANDWGVLVFVCLRPGSVQRSSAAGVLDTMAPRMLVIPQPDIAVVLRKRFQYASKYAGLSLPSDAYTHNTFGADADKQLPEASRFFAMCDDSIHSNPVLAEQFEAVSNGNIRRVMEYVQKVITSRHLDTQKILDKLAKPDGYTLADHETNRALIFGPYIHFDSRESLFTNLFDISHADPTEHFSRVFLLDYCHRHANSVTNHGYIPVTTLQEYMASLGYSANHITESLSLLVERNCLEGQDEYRDQEETPKLGADVRITSLGSFHITTLVRTQEYMDAISIDTPILDETVRASIKDVEDIRSRLKRARVFTAYLARQAEYFTDADARRVLDDILTAAANDITDIEADLKKS
ncbi:hypothetical protein Psta_0281 [Pirellula staleyi DSM 6068]|uniref:Orc1-like AAA ATPase domain-containing protein n=1 Tax=Pirellula staleyi (strain ATCC 27377 / DSM 6068 / ICPB 4128) TaxID=530564 RepID=D2R1J0_PIRSD|nr:hypothetical protein [Pirellula staleyi]ADB14975.1 hypothetical protein Psta_0281 [Pirellula staleyi DSM 6068]